MPIPASQISLAEIVVVGRMAASGVDTVPTINVFHYMRTNTSQTPSKIELDAAFDNNILDQLQLCLNNRWTHVLTRVRWVNDALDPYADSVGGGLGLVAGDSLPSDKCVYLMLRTGLRGKEFRGAKFIGPVSEADTTDEGDVLNAAGLARFQALATAINQDILTVAGITWSPCVFTRKGSQIRTNPTTIAAMNRLETVLVNQRLSTQERRRTASKY